MKTELKEISQIIELVYNEEKTYPGDLTHYFNILWKSKGVTNPYHNLRHILHVFWHTYRALMEHRDHLSPVDIRITLIAALFHDIDHIGKCGPRFTDLLNIEKAIGNLDEHLLPEDRYLFIDIGLCIKCTEFPHKDIPLPFHAKLLRDVDTASTLHTTWIQQTIFGLAEEMDMTPDAMLKMQAPFLSSLKFETEWAEKEYRPQIENRLIEVEKMLKCLDLC